MKKHLTLAAFALSTLTGCDWIANHFFNSVSLESGAVSDQLAGTPMRVYLGVDGLSYEMVRSVLEGDDTFKGNRRALTSAAKRLEDFKPTIKWSLAASTSMFPSTSDSCWTRMMRTSPMKGHEYAYYDPSEDRIVNAGISGLAIHVLPTMVENYGKDAEYMEAFDVNANGYLHRMVVYQNQFNSFGETLDQIFYVLDGRLRTQSTFSAYIAEIDAVGHMLESIKTDLLVRLLLKKIEDFRASHPEREIQFTLFSDHGMDFTPLPDDGVERRVKLVDIMPTVGVTPVTRLRGIKADLDAPQALPVGHVRVTYEAANTLPELVEAVSMRLSTARPIDLVLGRLPECPVEFEQATRQCHAIWAEGTRLLSFGFDPTEAAYRLRLDAPGHLVTGRLDLPQEGGFAGIETASEGELFKIDAQEAFDRTVWRTYPDLFHRIRTGLESQHVLHPPEILVSYRQGYVAKGFSMPFGSDDIASFGFHGALSSSGSLGVMMTTEKALPSAVRSEDLLDLFPELAKHVTRRIKEHRHQ